MKYRKLINGSKVPELTGTWEWIFESKCPAKWLHIDCENGRIYVQSTKGGGHQLNGRIYVQSTKEKGHQLVVGLRSQWEEPSDVLLDAGLRAIKGEIARRKKEVNHD